MPKFRNIKLTLLLQAVLAAAMAPAQQPVAVGRGSYAAFPPTYKSRTSAAPVMQGFLPHAYKHNVTSDVQFGDLTYLTLSGTMRMAEASFTPTPARYVRLQCNRRATGYGNSVHELEAYATSRYTDPSGVADVTAADADAPVDVYDTVGILLRRGVTCAEALDGLPAGIYVVGGKPVMKPF